KILCCSSEAGSLCLLDPTYYIRRPTTRGKPQPGWLFLGEGIPHFLLCGVAAFARTRDCAPHLPRSGERGYGGPRLLTLSVNRSVANIRRRWGVRGTARRAPQRSARPIQNEPCREPSER